MFQAYFKQHITYCSNEKSSRLNLKANVVRKETQEIKIRVSQADASCIQKCVQPKKQRTPCGRYIQSVVDHSSIVRTFCQT
jgi:hypothetical protein